MYPLQFGEQNRQEPVGENVAFQDLAPVRKLDKKEGHATWLDPLYYSNLERETGFEPATSTLARLLLTLAIYYIPWHYTL